jgi:Arc/MetJ-type ribon-helix-helix transcriptional regulator
MTRKARGVVVSALPLSSLPELERLLAPFLGDKGSRGHVVMVRLADDSVERLDQLVESGLFGSRSEAAAFLIGAGIQGQHELFERIAEQTSEIKKLRHALRETALVALGAGGPRTRAVAAAIATSVAAEGEHEEEAADEGDKAPARRPRRSLHRRSRRAGGAEGQQGSTGSTGRRT